MEIPRGPNESQMKTEIDHREYDAKLTQLKCSEPLRSRVPALQLLEDGQVDAASGMVSTMAIHAYWVQECAGRGNRLGFSNMIDAGVGGVWISGKCLPGMVSGKVFRNGSTCTRWFDVDTKRFDWWRVASYWFQ